MLLAHVRQRCVARGHPALLKLSRSKLHKILRQGELRPHKIRYYVEKRDPDFETKMAHVPQVYKEVEIVSEYRRGEAGRQLTRSPWPRLRPIVRLWWERNPVISGLTNMYGWAQCRYWPDNHSAHISKGTRGYLQTMAQRFVFVFTPTHGSWLNLIENQFSKMTRTMLRGIA